MEELLITFIVQENQTIISVRLKVIQVIYVVGIM